MRNLGKILLTGATGFIGRAIAAKLWSQQVPFIAPSRAELDLRDKAAVQTRYGADAFDTVIHFASRGVQSDARDITLIADERTMAEALLLTLREGGRFFYAGSVSEYGHSGRLMETDACSPQNAYARAKLETGIWLRGAAKSQGASVCVGRIFGAYGPFETAHRLLPSLIAALNASQPIGLSDGKQIRDFIYVGDVADVTLGLVACSEVPDCVNIGTGVGREVRWVVEELAREMGANRSLLHFGARERSPHDLDIQVANTKLLSESLGWVPQQRLKPNASILTLLRPQPTAT